MEKEQDVELKLADLEAATRNLIALYREQYSALRADDRQLEQRFADLAAKEHLLEGAQKKLERDSEGVRDVQKLAADRNVRMLDAQEREAKAVELRRKAEAELRQANAEKARLEAVIATLLQEKAQLTAKLTAATEVTAPVDELS